MLRKLVLCMLTLQSCTNLVFGQEERGALSKRIGELLDAGVQLTGQEVRELSADLVEEEKAALYQEHLKVVGVAPLLNVIPGAGLGSRRLGDRIGSLALTIGDLAGIGMFLGGAIWGLATLDIDLFGGESSRNPAAGTLITVGLITLGATRAVGVAMPALYVTSYNNRLRFALRLLP